MNPDKVELRMQQLRETAGKYAKAEAERSYLENFKHSKRAILMKKAHATGIESAAAQEREALADEEYKTFLDGLKVATEEAERLYWELKLAQSGMEIFRTMEASKRAERKGYGA